MMDYILRPDLAVGSVSPRIGTECIRVCRQSQDVSVKTMHVLCCIMGFRGRCRRFRCIPSILESGTWSDSSLTLLHLQVGKARWAVSI